MRITATSVGPNAATVRFDLVALVALAAVFVAIVLMHGMSGSHAIATHTVATPTMSADVGGEPQGSAIRGDAVAAGPFVVQKSAGLAGPVFAELRGTGEESSTGVAILTLVMLVPFVLLARGVKPSRIFLANPNVFGIGGTRTFSPAVSLRLAVSIDRR